MGIGFLLCDFIMNNRLTTKAIKLSHLAGIMSFLLLQMEVILLYKKPYIDSKGCFVFHLFFVPLFILGILNMKFPFKFSTIKIRRLSGSIYFVHAAFLRTVDMLPFFYYHKLLLAITTVSFCVIIALISYQSDKKWIHAFFG